jgi:hypothetical protein
MPAVLFWLLATLGAVIWLSFAIVLIAAARDLWRAIRDADQETG